MEVLIIIASLATAIINLTTAVIQLKLAKELKKDHDK